MAGSSALRLGTRAAAAPGSQPARAGRPPAGVPAGAPPSLPPPGPAAGGSFARSLPGRLLGGGVELLTAAAITVGFFAIFLLILAQVFPLGLSLETLSVQLQSQRRATWRAAGGASDGAAAAAATLASLAVLRSDVRSKPADAIAWIPARQGQSLHDRDGVQTGTQGRARLEFGAGSELVLERNSLVIVSADARGDAAGGGAVVVLEGEIWGRFVGAGARAPRLTIGGATVALAGGARTAESSEFRVRVEKGRAGTVSVLSGSLELESNGGQVRIGPRQFGSISADGTVATPRPLPGEPQALGPAADESFRYRDLPPRIAFRWSEVPGAERYRLIVARDRAGREVVVDETVAAQALTWGRLKEGRYAWRVSALAGDAEGAPSAWRALSVAREAEAPTLTVRALPKTVDASTVRLTGRIDRAATVYVSGVKVATRTDGGFEFEYALKPGANVIVVEAVDATGNTAYWSQIVNARF